MREAAHRGTSRSSRAPGRAGAGRANRPHASAGHTAARPAQSGRPGLPDGVGTARVTSLIEPVLNAMEIDLEAVKLSSAGRRAVLRVVVDADGGISLDDIAEVSREVSAKLDASDVMGDVSYTLEVTSPGVDRPLTQRRHWRRAAGRLVAFTVLADKDQDLQKDLAEARISYQGRVIGSDQDGVTVDIDGERMTFSFGELGPGRVQVEFGRLDETGDIDEPDDLDGFGAAGDSWQGADIARGGGPDEEEPDGH